MLVYQRVNWHKLAAESRQKKNISNIYLHKLIAWLNSLIPSKKKISWLAPQKKQRHIHMINIKYQISMSPLSLHWITIKYNQSSLNPCLVKQQKSPGNIWEIPTYPNFIRSFTFFSSPKSPETPAMNSILGTAPPPSGPPPAARQRWPHLRQRPPTRQGGSHRLGIVGFEWLIYG